MRKNSFKKTNNGNNNNKHLTKQSLLIVAHNSHTAAVWGITGREQARGGKGKKR